MANTSNNKRRQATVMAVETAFLQLLETAELKDIKVTDICKLAGVNRSTFYANYLDLYDLVDRIKEKIAFGLQDLYRTEIAKREHSYDFFKLLNHIYANRTLYKIGFKLGFDDFMRELEPEYSRKHAALFYKDEFIDYHVEFFRSGFTAVVRKWLDGDCRETPEEIMSIIKSEYGQKAI